ncbi:hypothetical protein ACIP9X_14520 [Arthrobacter sp. NPDC093125]|uniref:hypothetical protein n=1 Tax=Arthrobacter sp. NPDC093125 TaxID=3363944 RepID=UPI003830CFD6
MPEVITSSSKFLEAKFNSLHTKPTEKAPALAVMELLTRAKRDGVSGKEELTKAANELKTGIEKRTQEGRSLNYLENYYDIARDSVQAAGIIAGGTKLAIPLGVGGGAAVGGVGGAAAGGLTVSLLSDMISAGKDVADGILNLTPIQDMVKESRNLYSANAMNELVETYNDRSSEIIKEFHDQCLQAQDCRQAAAVMFPDLRTSGDEVDVRPGAVVNSNPDLFSPVIQNSVQVDLTIVIDLDELRASLTEEFQTTTGELRADLGEVRAELLTIKEEQKNLVAWLHNRAAQEDAQQRKALLEAKIQQRWGYAQQGIEVASVIAGLVDKKLGNDIRRVGGAALTVVKAGVELVKAATALSKGLEVATAMGSAAATGNFIGAAFALIGAFAPAGPTPEQMILEEIGALRQEMRDLQSEMNERFDRLDRTLNTIYMDVMTKLDKIDVALGKINGDVEEIQEDLNRIEASLMRHQLLLVNFFQAAHREDLEEAILTALDRPDRTNTPTMSSAEFMQYEGTFRTWASSTSGKEIEVPSAAWDTADIHLEEQLQGSALEHVAFLNEVVTENGWPPFAPLERAKRLHNAYTWILAASGYSELEREWPALSAAATRIDHETNRDQVAAPGGALLAALRKIPARNNGDLLGAAIGKVRLKYIAYGEQLHEAENEWASSGPVPKIPHPDPTVPQPPVWRADPYHDYGYAPNVPVWREGAAVDFVLPSAAVMRIPALYRNAARLSHPVDSNALRVVISSNPYSWTEKVTVVLPGRGPGRVDDQGVWQPPADREVTNHVARTGIKYSATVVYRDRPLQRYLLDAERGGELGRIWEVTWRAMIDTGDGFIDLPKDEAAALTDIENSRAWLWTDHFYRWLIDKQVDVAHPLRGAAVELNGALRLLTCLLELGLSSARVGDEAMQGVIDGAPVWGGGIGLFTSGQFLAHLDPLGSAPAPSPHSQGFPDYIAAMTKEPLELIAERVTAYQTALEAGTYAEFNRDIEITLARLAVAADIVELARLQEKFA